MIGYRRLAVCLKALPNIGPNCGLLRSADSSYVDMGEAFVTMQQELETADGQAGVGCNCQVVFARALTYYARRPTLLKQQLVPAITLNDQTLKLHIAIVSGDSKIKGDLLHRPNVGGTEAGRRVLQQFPAGASPKKVGWASSVSSCPPIVCRWTLAAVTF